MPLPDERPRQSVANLIGRFENQTKRQAPSNGQDPRSSSVASHNTGDSLHNEPREKREWPPRPVSERIASLETSPVQPRVTLPVSHSAPQPGIAPTSVELSKASSGASGSTPMDDQKETTRAEVKVESHVDVDNASTPDAKPVPPFSPQRSAQQTVKSTKAKGSPSGASRSLHRTASKPPAPKQPIPVIQPIKPQHSGFSTPSTASVKKSITIPPPIKTPVRSAAASTSFARPKTPSSGLFAPTAASLAKSRNAQAASTPTTPVKKTTLISSASDRLSKPTTASLSKTRTPVPPVPQLTRTNTKSTVMAHTSTKLAVKPKAIATPASTRKPLPIKKLTTTFTENAVSSADVPTVEDVIRDIESEHSEPNDLHPINGHSVEEHTEDVPLSGGSAEQIVEPAAQELTAEQEILDESTDNVNKLSAGVHVDADVAVDAMNEEGALASRPEAQSHIPSDASVTEPLDSELGQGESHAPQGDDIENIVNLLESASVSKLRPISITSIPDEVHEIPDEE